MDASSLATGATYYHVTFADTQLTMPRIEPMVYVGSGASPSGEQSHVFQDPISYVEHGSCLSSPASGKDEATIYLLPSEEVGAAVLDLAGVLQSIRVAYSRAEHLGFPRLHSIQPRAGGA